MKKYLIILSADTEQEFRWMTNEPNVKNRKKLIAEAMKHIKAGTDVLDVIRRLEQAGFQITRT